MAMNEAMVRIIVGSMTEDYRRTLRAEVDGVKNTIEELLANEKINIDTRTNLMASQLTEMQQRQTQMTEYVETKGARADGEGG